jgi:hypothetical protein
MLRSKPPSFPGTAVSATANTKDADDTEAVKTRPLLSAQLLRHVFGDADGLCMYPRPVLTNASFDSLEPLVLPVPRQWEYMQTVGQLLPTLANTKKNVSAIVQHLNEASDTRQALREFKKRRMDRDSKLFCNATQQLASCTLDVVEPPPAPSLSQIARMEPGESRWQQQRHADDPYDDELVPSSNENVAIPVDGGDSDDDDADDDTTRGRGGSDILQCLALAGLGLSTAAHENPRPPSSLHTNKAALVPQAGMPAPFSRPIRIDSFNYWANALKVTGMRRQDFLPIEVSLIENGMRIVEQIEKLMNAKPHYNAGPLIDPETGNPIGKLASPFSASDEMSAQDAATIHTFTDYTLVNSHLPRFILWMAPGDQLTDMMMGLPFLQVAPAVTGGTNRTKGLRQDLIYSIGRVSVYRAERKNWNDCLSSYWTKHYHAQRANMTRCGMSNCCVDFIVEYPRAMFIDRSSNHVSAAHGSYHHQQQPPQQPPVGQHLTQLDILMQEYGKHRAIEASTLQQSGIHTRRTIHLFDTVNMVLDDIRKLLEHGCAKYQNRVDHRPVCFTPDTSVSSSEMLSNKGRKSDLDNRHQFVVAFHASQMGVAERPCHALYDRYHSIRDLIMAYEKCDPDERDDMLLREVAYKDEAKYTLFGVAEEEETATEMNAKLAKGKRKSAAGSASGKGGKGASKAPFGAVLSARIHRFLYNLPAKVPKQSKARANRNNGPNDMQ